MLGIKAATANLTTFGDTKGVYVWVAGRAQTEAEFRHLIEAETSRRRLSLGEVADVMPAEVALNDRRDADIDWKGLISAANDSPSLVIDSTYFFYEEGHEGG